MELFKSLEKDLAGSLKSEANFRILHEGRNCLGVASAKRVTFLVDTESYFSAFAEAVLNARKSILIIGWDIDSRVRLFRDNGTHPFPDRLGEFLNWAVSRKPGLKAHVLVWDFSMIYALERELLPVFKLGWRTHRRLNFRMDSKHPMGASHHQKIVVIDDSVAFAGGIDLTKCRWDNPEHADNEPRRSDSGCTRFSPFHDIQMAVDSEAAAALGDLARQRWLRATGDRISPTGEYYPDAWPTGLAPDMENVRVGISRTEPFLKDSPEVREVEILYRDSIRAARNSIYLEHQYLTSSVICQALSDRLRETDCPEIVIVLPRKSSGWLEEGTMDALRQRILQKLNSEDVYGRLRIYYPKLPGNHYLNVHSKVTIVDDDFLRIGSSNLSNRSMGFDTECDLSIEAQGREDLKAAIGRFRARLIGEHLGVPGEAVFELVSEKGSITAAIQLLRGGDRSLDALDGEGVQEILDSYLYDTSLIDPECPAPPAELIDQFVPDGLKRSGVRHAIWGVLTLMVLLGLAAAWTWTPLRHWVSLDLLLYYTSFIANRRTAPLIVLAAFIIGGLIHFPVTLLIVATAITFEPFTAFIYALAGTLSSAATLYWAGRLLGRNAISRFGGRRLNRLSRRLAKQGIFTITMIRLVPIAPFSFVNFVAGVSHIKFTDFLIGTAVGLLPGLIAITLLGGRLGEAIRHPKVENFLVLAGLITLFVSANILVRRWLEKRGKNNDRAGALKK